MTRSMVTDEMRSIVGKVMRETVSHPISLADIRKWVMAVYYPDPPPRQFWDEAFAATLPQGGIVAPEDFNPFAWMTAQPTPLDPPISQTAFSEAELGVDPPAYKAMLLTDIKTRHNGQAMRPGDVIRSTHKITDYFEREGRMGHMLYTTLSHELTNQDGAWIRTTDSVLVRY